MEVLGSADLLDLTSVARIMGYSIVGDALDAAVSPHGYRLLSKVPRLPGAIVSRLVEHFGSLQKLLAAGLEDLMAPTADLVVAGAPHSTPGRRGGTPLH